MLTPANLTPAASACEKLRARTEVARRVLENMMIVDYSLAITNECVCVEVELATRNNIYGQAEDVQKRW